jgi:hypothetical protein
MKKIAFALVPFLGVALAKAEALAEQRTQNKEVISIGPRKNYRAKLARQYFGSGAGSCRRWNRFCGR